MKPAVALYKPTSTRVEVLSYTADDKAMIRLGSTVTMVPVSDLEPNPRLAFYRGEMEMPRWQE